MQYRPRHPPGRNFRSEGAYHEDHQRHAARTQFPQRRRDRIRRRPVRCGHQRDPHGRTGRHACLRRGTGPGQVHRQRRRHRGARQVGGGQSGRSDRRFHDRRPGIPGARGRNGRGRRLRAEAARREAHEPAEVHHVLG